MKAYITGIDGQDGSFLAELLLSKGYEVHGLMRRGVNPVVNINHLLGKIHIHYGDLANENRLCVILNEVKPDEIYNLAGQSDVRISFDIPEYTGEITGLGVVRLLEAARVFSPHSKIYQASSSEMFGDAPPPQNELTPFKARSPYGAAKIYAHNISVNYREAYGMFVCCGILFNHESERRGLNFVTRKISNATARIKLGKQNVLELGNMESKRDWGYSPDYCINKDVPILTTKGWVLCDDIDIGSEIINFNTETNKLDKDVVLNKVELKSGGQKIQIYGRGVYLNVTPNHRIYYQSKSKTSKGGWSQWKVCTAEEFHKKIEDKSYRTKYDYRLPHFQGYDIPSLDCVSDEQIYLIGALVTEGYLKNSPIENGGIEVSLSQSHIANKEVHNKIEVVLSKLDLKYRTRNRNDGVTIWSFDSHSSSIILSWFDTNDIHILPRYVYQFNQHQAQVLFDSMMDCDGSRGSFTFVSKRYLLAVDFQTIACLAGYRTTQITKRDVSNCYDVCVIVKRKKHPYIQKTALVNDLQQNVWCVTTKNGTIISRDKDCINISGNCEAMWLMLQQDKPDDYVVGTGVAHSVKDFVVAAFEYLNLDWQKYVKVDTPKDMRPSEVGLLLADASKANVILGWKPKTKFDDLVKIMVDYDLEANK